MWPAVPPLPEKGCTNALRMRIVFNSYRHCICLDLLWRAVTTSQRPRPPLPVGDINRPRSSPDSNCCVGARCCAAPIRQVQAAGYLEELSDAGSSRTPFYLACRTHLAVLVRPVVGPGRVRHTRMRGLVQPPKTLEPIGYIPPAEKEANYREQNRVQLAGLNQNTPANPLRFKWVGSKKLGDHKSSSSTP